MICNTNTLRNTRYVWYIAPFPAFITYPALALIFNIVDMIAYLMEFVFWGILSNTFIHIILCTGGKVLVSCRLLPAFFANMGIARPYHRFTTRSYPFQNIHAYGTCIFILSALSEKYKDGWEHSYSPLTSNVTLPQRFEWKVWVSKWMGWENQRWKGITRAPHCHGTNNKRQHRTLYPVLDA